MPDNKPVQPPKVPVVKIQTPVAKPPMPGGTAPIMRIQDSLDRKKFKN